MKVMGAGKSILEPSRRLGFVRIAHREAHVFNVEVDRDAVNNDHHKRQDKRQGERKRIAADMKPFLAGHGGGASPDKSHRFPSTMRIKTSSSEGVMGRMWNVFSKSGRHLAQASGFLAAAWKRSPYGSK